MPKEPLPLAKIDWMGYAKGESGNLPPRVVECSEYLTRSGYALDTETVERDELSQVISVGVVRIHDQEIVYESKVKMQKGVVFGGTHIHGMHEADLKGAPSFKDVWGELNSIVGSAPLVAYNAEFDRAQLYYTWRRAKITGGFPNWDWYCAWRGMAALYSRSPTGLRLGDACSMMGVPYENAHTAGGDALTLAKLVHKMALA